MDTQAMTLNDFTCNDFTYNDWKLATGNNGDASVHISSQVSLTKGKA